MINPKYLPEANELRKEIRRSQRFLNENPWCAGMVNPENYHAARAREVIATNKAKLAKLRSKP